MIYLRTGECNDCGWCCERTIYFDYPEEFSETKAKILAFKESNTDKRFIKNIVSWIEETETCYDRRRVVKVEIGCKYLDWTYESGRRVSFCTVYNDPSKGCNFERRKSFPESVNDLPTNGLCGYHFLKKKEN